jgi:hypothetical protein
LLISCYFCTLFMTAMMVGNSACTWDISQKSVI